MGWLALGALGGAAASYMLSGGKKCPFYTSASASRDRPVGLKEFSVVYTDRALNHMSAEFQEVMNDINRMLKQTYNGDYSAVVPGSGSYAMEAVARSIGGQQKCMVLRNGYFSYRWSDIFERSRCPKEEIVVKAQIVGSGDVQVKPQDLDDVLLRIEKERPDVVFAPHVETSTGVILPDEYIKAVGAKLKSYGGIFVLDAIAAGTVWADIKALNVDFLITAPQKGWSGPACAGLVVMSEFGYKRLQATDGGDSLATNLKMWTTVMDQYVGGAHKYWTTMPTDALRTVRDMMAETVKRGCKQVTAEARELGKKMRARLASKGFKSVAADGFAAPGVVVVYTPPSLRNKKMAVEFKNAGIQIAGGVPWKLDEPEGTGPKCTFRLGLFGLDKLANVDKTVDTLMAAVSKIEASA